MGTISHLLPPEYHADPLCFYHFGWDLLDALRSLGFRDTLALIYWTGELGYLGIRKASPAIRYRVDMIAQILDIFCPRLGVSGQCAFFDG